MKIGNVIVNMDYYDESFTYSEGDIEDELLEIVKSNATYDDILMDDNRWSILYHLHSGRENVLAWYPFTGEETVLEVGAGCGAITGLLARSCKRVVCNDISLRRSQINAYKNSEYSNIEIDVGNFMSVDFKEKFDIITLIGVLEYAENYVHEENPFVSMLKITKGMLKEGGKLIIAIENKFGLKYWAGCREDHTARFYEGIEGYPNTQGVRTFSKKQLCAMLQEAGLAQYEFYYPLPDYKFAKTVFSDKRLPSAGEIGDIYHNYDNDRLVTFDEPSVYDQVIHEGMFDFFANSFLITAGIK
ncbi:MAG: class I SAM-dependent methyltransferase [Christensenella sp.]